VRLSGGLNKKERSKAVATKMLALFETPAGFALFKVLNEKKLDNVEDLWKEFETPEVAWKVKLAGCCSNECSHCVWDTHTGQRY
jgi:hypothetical protein